LLEKGRHIRELRTDQVLVGVADRIPILIQDIDAVARIDNVGIHLEEGAFRSIDQNHALIVTLGIPDHFAVGQHDIGPVQGVAKAHDPELVLIVGEIVHIPVIAFDILDIAGQLIRRRILVTIAHQNQG